MLALVVTWGVPVSRRHVDLFASALTMSADDEHRLEYYDVYREYLDEFEKKIHTFIERTGHSVDEFQTACQKVLEEEGEFSPKRFFVEALLATTEYPIFLSLMKGEARKYVSSGK
uniref:BART domain-containing protein n=1 Tax=Rhizochromulina marina TaxID=1034831 RepID=A0A7S2SVE5_9STRA